MVSSKTLKNENNIKYRNPSVNQHVCRVSHALLNISIFSSSMGQCVVLKAVLCIVSLLIILSLVMCSSYTVYAGDFDDNPLSYAPPGLDEQQSQRWINALPSARPYLARIFGIDYRVAQDYGAEYVMPICGIGASDSYNTPSDLSVYSDMGITLSGNSHYNRWNMTFNPIAEFYPIPVVFPQKTETIPVVVKYDAPPGLDLTQQTRWGQALPSARPYLARLWGISIDEAIKYGATY